MTTISLLKRKTKSLLQQVFIAIRDDFSPLEDPNLFENRISQKFRKQEICCFDKSFEEVIFDFFSIIFRF